MKFSLEYFCEPLQSDSSYFSKRMFGGLAVYHQDLMKFALFENPGDREYRKKKYDFDLWNGVLVCTHRDCHESLLKDWPSLISHPVLGKWLYLCESTGNFETVFNEIVNAAKNNDPRIGIVPGKSKKRKK